MSDASVQAIEELKAKLALAKSERDALEAELDSIIDVAERMTCAHTAAHIEIERLSRELEASRAAYHELLYAVARKHPNETRHETALRYIRQAEQVTCELAQDARGGLGGDGERE